MLGARKTTTLTNGVKYTESHEWIALDFGNGRGFSSSYGGEKGRGLADGIFDKLLAFLGDAKNGADYRERMKKMGEEIATIWPEWNVVTALPTVGTKCRLDFGKRRNPPSGICAVEVVKVRRYNVTLRIEGMNGLLTMSGDMFDGMRVA
jgi:hypothetical protein